MVMSLNNYFVIKEENSNDVRIQRSIKLRKNRGNILNSFKVLKFSTGDILSVVYRKRTIIYMFEGICMSLNSKKLLKPDASLLLRMFLWVWVLSW